MRERRRGVSGGAVSWLVLVQALGVASCAGRAEDDGAGEVRASDLTSEGAGGADQGASEAQLTAGGDCDVLLERLQLDLLEQVEARARAARAGQDYYYYGGVFIDEAPALAATDSAVAVNALSGNASSGFAAPTLQVASVDEGDFVKTEGGRIYLLQDSTLFIVETEPAPETRLLGSVLIEGQPVHVLAEDGRVVVFSRFYGTPPILGSEAASPYYYSYPTFTKITVVDVADGTPEVVRESFVEGEYVSSRRHDSVVRAVVQHGVKAALDYPSVAYVDIFGNPNTQAEIDLQVSLWVLLTEESIFGSEIEDYLPAEYEIVGGRAVRQPLRCGDYFLPGPGLTQAGASSVVAFDLDALGDPLRSATVLGAANQLYANDDVVLVTQADYRYYTGELPTEQTHIHRFALDGVNTTYTASGTVAGYIQNQYSLDEADGVVRLSTTENIARVLPVDTADETAPPVFPTPVSRVLTLGTQGRRLVELGRTPDFGEDESIYATRFIGERAYVVTFRQIDPLFVIDLENPASPQILGHLEIPGFSNFLFPLPDNHLLAIGQDADEQGVVQNASLQIFDVRDASAPALAHKFVLPRAGYTDATYDAHALTFYPDRQLVSFPFQSYDTGESTLEVFRVDNAEGITHLGSVAPPTAELTLEECLIAMGYGADPYYVELLEQDPAFRESIIASCIYYQEPLVRRGLFRDDEVFAVSSRSVDAYALGALDAAPIGRAQLPATYPYYYYYPTPGIIAGTAGAGGAPAEPPPFEGSGGGAPVEPLPPSGGGGAPAEPAPSEAAAESAG